MVMNEMSPMVSNQCTIFGTWMWSDENKLSTSSVTSTVTTARAMSLRALSTMWAPIPSYLENYDYSVYIYYITKYRIVQYSTLVSMVTVGIDEVGRGCWA